MAVTVAEYLGIRTDIGRPISPLQVSKGKGGRKPTVACPFKNSHCEKAKRGDKPVCSLRDTSTNEIWIVCPSRLCATMKGRPVIDLNEHQKRILHSIAKHIFEPDIPRGDVLVDREVSIPVTEQSDYSADYVMWRKNPLVANVGVCDRPVILEMQGGGETTSTGSLTEHISAWEQGQANLTDPVSKTAPLVTNAWRRQQEQFLVKGNTAMLSGGRIVFCIGKMIRDYLMPRLTSTTNFPDLRDANWTLALLTIVEDKDEPFGSRPNCAPYSVPLKIAPELSLFTNYGFFVQSITNQGTASTAIFDRSFTSLE